LKTESFTPALILIRGLPGAGKTTLANVLSEEGLYPIFSVDDYFTNSETGEYKFVFSDNHLAYSSCLEKVELAMQKSVKKIFVHNTLTLDWEIEHYFRIQKKEKTTRMFESQEEYDNLIEETSEGEQSRSWATFLKAYAIAFVITFAIFYFTSDSGTDEVIDNMIKGAPDF
jgi:thymidylate kinase